MPRPKHRSQPPRPAGERMAPTEAPVPTDTAPAALEGAVGESPDERLVLEDLLGRLESLRDCRIIAYWTSPMARISDAVIIPLHDQLTTIGKVKRLGLFLETGGGDVEVPWRMISLLREFCGHLTVIVPHRAASAGTLTALGANEIVMTPLSVLGPIDPSRGHPLLPRKGDSDPEPISVQDMRHAMQFIREAAGSDNEMPYTPEAMAQIFAALFDKIHPLAIGAIEQSYALSKLIGTRCLQTHMTAEDDELEIKRIVDTLCDDFKSHQYPIPRAEAKRIGLNVVDATPDEEAVINDVFKFGLMRPFWPAEQPKPGKPFEHRIAWLDSTQLHLTAEARAQIDDVGKVTPLGDRWTVY